MKISSEGNKTILQLIANDERRDKIEFHCKEGYCGTCSCKLLKGQVEYESTPIASIRDGHILPCVAIPEREVEIESHF